MDIKLEIERIENGYITKSANPNFREPKRYYGSLESIVNCKVVEELKELNDDHIHSESEGQKYMFKFSFESINDGN